MFVKNPVGTQQEVAVQWVEPYGLHRTMSFCNLNFGTNWRLHSRKLEILFVGKLKEVSLEVKFNIEPMHFVQFGVDLTWWEEEMNRQENQAGRGKKVEVENEKKGST